VANGADVDVADMDVTVGASARVVSPGDSQWAALCPYLRDASGTWRAVRSTGLHRCTAITPPPPLRAEQQRRLCLGVGHLECPTYLAAREMRTRAFADIGEPWPASRRAIARTSPIVLQRPAPAVVALSLLRDSAPQVGLVVLMLLGAAALVLARFAAP